MEFGKTLREAREAKGYTIAQLADLTHILPQIIEGMESEDFKKVVASIYGRGFVKLLCQHLDLDQKTMVGEFMALYTGEKPVAPVAPIAPPAIEKKPEEPPARKLPIGSDEVPVQDPQRDLFEQPIAEPPPARMLSRFAPPTPEDDGPRYTMPIAGIPWRLVLLIAGTLAILGIAIMSCRAIYRELSEPTDKTTAIKVVPRTPKPVKPLYID